METPPQEKPPADPSFRFVSFWLDRLAFETVERASVEPDEKRPHSPGCEITFGANSAIDPANKRGRITVKAVFASDPKWQPYRIEMEITGRFAITDGTPADLDAFMRINAPTILFPYIREIVHRTTKDGQFGPVLLDPINIGALFGSQWNRTEGPVELPPSQIPSSPEPPQS